MTDTSTEVKEQKDIIQAEKNKRSKYKVCVVLRNSQGIILCMSKLEVTITLDTHTQKFISAVAKMKLTG